MMNPTRCQRRVAKNIINRKISEEQLLAIKSIRAEKNHLFEFITSNVLVKSVFYMSQITMASTVGAHKDTVNGWIKDFKERGFFKVINRGVKKTCIYKATKYLRRIIILLLPLMPTLYSLRNTSFYTPRNCQTGKNLSIVNKEIILPSGNNIIDLFSYYSSRDDSVRRREAALSLLAMGPQSLNGSKISWVRGNAPEFDNSTVEKEREMANENYEALRELDRQERLDRNQTYWRDPQLSTQMGVPSHKKSYQNHGSRSNESHQMERAPQTYQNKNVESPPRYEVGADGMITVKGKKFLPQRLNKQWEPPKDFIDDRDVPVERAKFEKLWEDPEVKALAKKGGTVGLAHRSFYAEHVEPYFQKRQDS